MLSCGKKWKPVSTHMQEMSCAREILNNYNGSLDWTILNLKLNVIMNASFVELYNHVLILLFNKASSRSSSIPYSFIS